MKNVKIDSGDKNLFNAAALRVMRALSEKDSFALATKTMPLAALFEPEASGELKLIGREQRSVIEQMYLRDWLTQTPKGDVYQYLLTSAGKAAAKRLEARLGDDPFLVQHQVLEEKEIVEENTKKRYRVNLAESPIQILARKRDKNGKKYLDPRMIAAAERLREDFEIGQIGPQVTQNWERMLTGVSSTRHDHANLSGGRQAARERWGAAMKELGPGLCDITFRVCCCQEGLETAEKMLGWSARSGKIVLRIALMRLADFYEIPKTRV